MTNIYPPYSKIASQDAGAAVAVEKEFDQLEASGAIRPNEPQSWPEIQRLVRNARRCDLMMVIVQKNVESAMLQRWKARAVARGDLLRGVSGERIIEDLTHVTPSSLEATRLGFA